MKKIFLIGAAALGMFFMTTSCMDNTEPAGIEEMRMAKSELLRAEALYKQALAATEQANAAIKQADAEYKELVNQLKEIEVQEAQIDLEVYQKQQELKLIELEYEHQAAIAEDSATIMQWKSKIAWYEWEIIRCQKEAEDLENKRLEALEQHKAYMYDLQALTAEAQQRYEDALAKIEAASYGLTSEEEKALNQMISNMKWYRGELNKAEDALISAQKALVDAQFALDRDTVYYQTLYTAEIEANTQRLAIAQENLEEAKAMDFTDAEALVETRDGLEEQVVSLNAQIAELRSQAASRYTAEITPLENEKRVLDQESDNIDNEIKNLYLELGISVGGSGGGTTLPDLDARTTFKVAVDEVIVPYVADVVKDFFLNAGINTGIETTPGQAPGVNDVIIISDFELVDGEWTLPGGVFSWESSYEKAKEILYGTNGTDGLMADISKLVYDPVGLANAAIVLSEQQKEQENITAEYTYFLGVFNEGLAAFNTAAATYGITYGSDDRFAVDPKNNLLLAAQKAREAYNEGVATATGATEAQIAALVNAVYAEQNARQTLVGTAVANWKDFTVANLSGTSPKITIQDVLNALTNAESKTVESYLNDNTYPEANATIDTETDLKDFSAAAKWKAASQALYDLDYVRKAFDEAYVGLNTLYTIEVNVANVLGGLGNEVELKPVEGKNNDTVTNYLDALGYEEPSNKDIFLATVYAETLTQPEVVAAVNSVINDNSKYSDLVAALDVVYDDILEHEKSNTEAEEEVYGQIRDLWAKLDSIKVETAEIERQIANIKLDIQKIAAHEEASPGAGYDDATYSQAALLQEQIDEIENNKEILNQAINAIKFEIDDKDDVTANSTSIKVGDVTYNSLEEAHIAWVELLTEKVADAQRTLSESEEYLERLLYEVAGGKTELVELAVEKAQRAVEDAQQDYNIALQQFNYWNEMMNQMLAALLGNEEVPENPEA